MLIRPCLQLDEMDRGYLGRVMCLNGFWDKKLCLAGLRAWAGDDPNPGPRQRTGTQDYLSRIAGIALDQFIADHTTLPWRRAISPHKVNVEHGGENSASIVAISGFRLARSKAYFCPECVSDDLSRLGYSYWRRNHQLPGCQSCSKHGVSLIAVKSKWAFLQPPAHYLEHHASARQKQTNWHFHPLVQRFNEIALVLMRRRQPISAAIVRQVLHRQGQQKGFQVSSGEVRRPLMSDFIRQSFPREWLAEVFPAILSCPKGELLNKLDGVFFFSNGASSVEASFIALAVLFASSEEALSQLEQIEALPPKRSVRSCTPAVDTRALVEAYVEARGSHGIAGKRCGVSQILATKTLAALGLPNLASGRQHRGVLKAAMAFYVERLGICESALLGGVPVADLEALVRRSSPQFVQALELIAIGDQEVALAA